MEGGRTVARSPDDVCISLCFDRLVSWLSSQFQTDLNKKINK